MKESITWKDIVVTTCDGDGTESSLPRMMQNEDEVLAFRHAYINPETGEIYGWHQYFLSAPGEDPDWDTPKMSVDWTGFLNALRESIVDQLVLQNDSFERMSIITPTYDELELLALNGTCGATRDGHEIVLIARTDADHTWAIADAEGNCYVACIYDIPQDVRETIELTNVHILHDNYAECFAVTI